MALLDLQQNPDARTRAFVPKPGRHRVIEPDNVYTGVGKHAEAALVAHMTPFLAALLPSCDLVNSENLVWLEMDNALDEHKTKPDLFWCHSVCWTKGNDDRADFDDRNFGIIPSRSLYADVVLADCKVVMTNKAIGELMNHLHQLSHTTKQSARGIVFARSDCRALEIGVDGSIIRYAQLDLIQARAAIFVCLVALPNHHVGFL